VCAHACSLYRTLTDLHTQALVYECEGDLARAYMMFKTLCRFFLHIVASHNAFGSKLHTKERLQFTRTCNESLKTIEAMHVKLLKQYEQDFLDHQAQLEADTTANRRAEEETRRKEQELRDFETAAALAQSLKDLSPSPPPATAATASAALVAAAAATITIATTAVPMSAASVASGASAVPAAAMSFESASSLPPSVAYPSVHPAPAATAGSAVHPSQAPRPAAPQPRQFHSQHHLQQAQLPWQQPQQQFASHQPQSQAPPPQSRFQQPPASIPPTPHYTSHPSIPPRSTQDLPAASAPDLSQFSYAQPPPQIHAGACTPSSAPAPAPAAATRTPPVISETLRPIHLPTNVLADFYAFAAANTDANVETCGILCGRFDATTRDLWITHVIIPNQTATADTCCTTDEEQLIALQIHHDLLTLGWVSGQGARDSNVIALDT
jgi:STAM-binding protein